MGVRLFHHGGSGHIVVHEPKDDSAYHGQHQERHHACNVVSGARSDGFVDKTLAQPYHQQSERNAPGSRQNPNGDACAETPHRLPQVTGVFHSTTLTFCHSPTIAMTSALSCSGETSYSFSRTSARESTVHSPRVSARLRGRSRRLRLERVGSLRTG